MRQELKEISEQIILAGEKLAPLNEKGIIIQSFRVDGDFVYVALLSGIEKIANIYGIKSIFIEDGIVRAEDDGICFYQYALEKDRRKVMEGLLLEREV